MTHKESEAINQNPVEMARRVRLTPALDTQILKLNSTYTE